MYLIVDVIGKVACVTDRYVYTKIQESNGIWICCEEQNATAVYVSSCEKHYPIKSNIYDGITYNVVQVESVPDDINVYEYYYSNNGFQYVQTFDEMKAQKQLENKIAFKNYLSNQSITWTDGKQYGVTEEDQYEISLNLTQYQLTASAGIEAPILEWHAIHEECVPWDFMSLSALVLQITTFVYPHYHKMQQYKTAIYNATSPADLTSIVFQYDEV